MLAILLYCFWDNLLVALIGMSVWHFGGKCQLQITGVIDLAAGWLILGHCFYCLWDKWEMTLMFSFGSVQNLILELETRPWTEPFRIHSFSWHILSTNKRGLEQGNVSEVSVSHSDHRGSLWYHVLSGWLPTWSHVHSKRFLSLFPCSFQGVSVWRNPPPPNKISGQFASYCNASLSMFS